MEKQYISAAPLSINNREEMEMDNSNNGWDKISEQSNNSVKQNKRKENLNTGYNISMGVIAIITIVSLIIIGVCIKLLGG